MDTKNILDIIQKNSNSKGRLISILEEIQEEYTYLPETALRQVAEETGFSLTDIYGVATFYKAFSLKPRGKHCVSACLGTACHVRGAQKIVEKFAQQLKIKPGETTPDNEITFETVNCLGACALGPIVVSDGHYFANVTAGKVKKILRDTKVGSYGDGESKEYEFTMDASCPRCNRGLMDSEHCLDGHPSISITVSMDGKSGWARMPSLYGHFARVHEHEIPQNTIVSMLCPHCRSILQDSFSCVECGAPLASMKINGGDGVLRICTREGCNGHLLELNGTAF
ncbi:MAG: NAD(P)H-dependent oxidoreductase subunit E [Smithellaceae bacterium]|nr:NAD(P)H-dependent oxidoreductase subunit E [Smithellaceae bacterium]